MVQRKVLIDDTYSGRTINGHTHNITVRLTPTPGEIYALSGAKKVVIDGKVLSYSCSSVTRRHAHPVGHGHSHSHAFDFLEIHLADVVGGVLAEGIPVLVDRGDGKYMGKTKRAAEYHSTNHDHVFEVNLALAEAYHALKGNSKNVTL